MWEPRWTVVADGFLYYFSDLKRLGKPERVLSLAYCTVEAGKDEEGKNNTSFIIQIPGKTSKRFQAINEDQQKRWIQVINQNIRCNKSNSSFFFYLTLFLASKLNRYDSFAPIRPQCHGSYYIDGKDTYKAMADALRSAQETVRNINVYTIRF